MSHLGDDSSHNIAIASWEIVLRWLKETQSTGGAHPSIPLPPDGPWIVCSKMPAGINRCNQLMFPRSFLVHWSRSCTPWKNLFAFSGGAWHLNQALSLHRATRTMSSDLLVLTPPLLRTQLHRCQPQQSQPEREYVTAFQTAKKERDVMSSKGHCARKGEGIRQNFLHLRPNAFQAKELLKSTAVH